MRLSANLTLYRAAVRLAVPDLMVELEGTAVA